MNLKEVNLKEVLEHARRNGKDLSDEITLLLSGVRKRVRDWNYPICEIHTVCVTIQDLIDCILDGREIPTIGWVGKDVDADPDDPYPWTGSCVRIREGLKITREDLEGARILPLGKEK